MARKRYAEEYKKHLLDLVREGRSPEQLAQEYEPSARTIRNWVRENEVKRRLKEKYKDHELRRLKAENARLREKRCKTLGVKISMGSVGDCYDNAMAESFFATLEPELLNIVPLFSDPQHAQSEIFKYIEGFYNVKRRHSQLNQMSPTKFESTHKRDQVA